MCRLPDTDEIGLDPKRLYVTVFAGDSELGIGPDEESVDIWKTLFKEKGIEAAKGAAQELTKKYAGKCVFDRNGYRYHGRIKFFADAAREEGLKF
jgi:hypothetical protein